MRHLAGIAERISPRTRHPPPQTGENPATSWIWFHAEEFHMLTTEKPIDVAGLHRRIRGMIESAASFINQMPSEAVGFVF